MCRRLNLFVKCRFYNRWFIVLSLSSGNLQKKDVLKQKFNDIIRLLMPV